MAPTLCFVHTDTHRPPTGIDRNEGRMDEIVIDGLSNLSPQLFCGATTIVAGSLATEALAS
jgi:hypothetical protein